VRRWLISVAAITSAIPQYRDSNQAAKARALALEKSEAAPAVPRQEKFSENVTDESDVRIVEVGPYLFWRSTPGRRSKPPRETVHLRRRTLLGGQYCRPNDTQRAPSFRTHSRFLPAACLQNYRLREMAKSSPSTTMSRSSFFGHKSSKSSAVELRWPSVLAESCRREISSNARSQADSMLEPGRSDGS
jgi:hypothetical protein